MSGLDSSAALAQADASRVASAAAAYKKGGHMDMRKMRQTAQDFEAVYISEMLRPMFQNIDAEAPFGGSSGEKMYRDMQVDEYGKAIAKSGGIGLADAVVRQMIKMQESK